MNKIILAGALLPLLVLAMPELANAHSQSSNHFGVGWSDGQNTAAVDYTNGVQYQTADTNCGDHHTKQYCSGYWAGYNDEWTRSVQQNGNVVQTQGADQNTNIKGNNNKVTNVINQGATSGDTSGGSSGGSGDNPQCRLLCGSVNIK